METPLSTQIKNIFEKALAEHKTTIHFEYYNSRYNITFNNSVNFNDIDNAALKKVVKHRQIISKRQMILFSHVRHQLHSHICKKQVMTEVIS